MGLLSLLFGSKKEKEKLTHFLNQKHIILDVRTEKEYKMDHMPLEQVYLENMVSILLMVAGLALCEEN